ncbi:MAG TPA: hypothetical protein PKD85_20735, partial [Saprospiraceae bacterium]|nr:hypothetical protein [Saprospiraceae bacterium]
VIFDNGIYGKIHYVSAVLLFLTLALFCMLQFTKTGPNSYIFSAGIWSSLTTKKKSEIKFYIYCGFLIIICMILAAIYFSLGDDNEFKKKLLYYKPIFWLETLMLWAFSAAWLRKSKFFGVYHTVL